MSWKTVTTYVKLMFLFRNHDLHAKGEEEQGGRNKPLYSISSQHASAVPTWIAVLPRPFCSAPPGNVRDQSEKKRLSFFLSAKPCGPSNHQTTKGKQLLHRKAAMSRTSQRNTKKVVKIFQNIWHPLIFTACGIFIALLPLILLPGRQSPEGLPSA